MPHKRRTHRHASKESKSPKTLTCQTCREAIEVPDQCQHGKKLANCQVTGCITAHITAHNDTCVFQSTRREPGIQPADQKSSQTEHAILSHLIKQELRNIEGIRGKELQYLKGLPRDEALERLDCMALKDLRGLAAQLKSISEGKMTAENAMYDDEESSDDDTMRCNTPPEEE